MVTIFCPILSILLLLIIMFYYFKFRIINKKYYKKIDILGKQIIENQKNLKSNKIKSYYEFFGIVRRIYSNFKPSSISVFIFSKNLKLQLIDINFLYQIKSDGDGSILFTGDYGKVPITNVNIISQLYQKKENIQFNDISEFNNYDKGLHEFLQKKDIKKLCLVNIFNKTKPIGFFALTYKENFLSKNDEILIIKESEKISKHLLNIIK